MSKPKIPTIAYQTPIPGQPPVSTKERQPYAKLVITDDDMKSPGTAARILQLMQDNVDEATKGARSNPLGSPYVVKNVTFTAGTISTVNATGTTPPKVSLSGNPLGNYTVQIKITTPGGLGTAVFQWSSDGQHFVAGVTTSASVPLGNTGLTANFPDATYAADNVYNATTTVTPVKLRHGLNEAVGSWHPSRTYPGSQPFSAVEVTPGNTDWNTTTYPTTQYVLFYPASTGTYDIALYPH